MFRRLRVATSVLALLLGLVAAPDAHVHQSAHGLSDAQQSHRITVLHAHVTPHPAAPDSHHHPVDNSHDTDQEMWSVDGFVFQPASPQHAPLPAVVVSHIVHVMSAGTAEAVSVTQPRAHGPPAVAGPSLRGPPPTPAVVS